MQGYEEDHEEGREEEREMNLGMGSGRLLGQMGKEQEAGPGSGTKFFPVPSQARPIPGCSYLYHLFHWWLQWLFPG